MQQAGGGGTVAALVTQSLMREASRLLNSVGDTASVLDGVDLAAAAIAAELGKQAIATAPPAPPWTRASFPAVEWP